MTKHAEPADLLAYAEGRASAESLRSTEAALAACDHCRRRLADFQALSGAWTDGYGDPVKSSDPDARVSGTPPDDDDRRLRTSMDAIIREAATRGAARARGAESSSRGALTRVVIGVLLLAVAALLFKFTVGAREGVDDVERTPLRGTMVVAEVDDTVRGAGDRTYHFEIEVDEGGYLALFRMSEGRVDRVYPDPNPVVGAYGRETPFAAGERARIPPARTFDPTLRAGEAAPACFVARFPEAPQASALDSAAAEASRAASDGSEAVRTALAKGLGAPVVAIVPR